MPTETRSGQHVSGGNARLFVALWPDPALAAQLAELAQQAAACYGGRPTRIDTIHLTLAFLGDVAETGIPALCDALRKVRSPAFNVTIDRLGVWSHNRLLWAGCQVPPEALLALHRQLIAVLTHAGFPAVRQGPGFQPHVTLVRKLVTTEIGFDEKFDLTHRSMNLESNSFRLVRSIRPPGEVGYQAIGHFLLD